MSPLIDFCNELDLLVIYTPSLIPIRSAPTINFMMKFNHDTAAYGTGSNKRLSIIMKQNYFKKSIFGTIILTFKDLLLTSCLRLSELQKKTYKIF
jgi:hypothetical protein